MYDFQSPDLYDGAGSATHEEVALLVKALEAQEGITDIAQLKDVGALTPQSLEGMLAVLTAQEKHLTLYRDVPKGNAVSTLEEYNLQLGHGQEASWSQQMESPLEADPSFKRKFSVVKFLRSMWKVSDVAGIVRTVREPEVLAKQAATMRILRTLNRTLYSGDSAIVSDSIDGFDKIIATNGSTAHTIDRRGNAIDLTAFQNAAELIHTSLGNADGVNCYLSPGGVSAVAQMLQSTSGIAQNNVARIMQGTVGADGQVGAGFGVSHVFTPFGRINLKSDIFIAGEYEGHGVPMVPDSTNPENLIEGATSQRSPATPTLGVAAIAGPSALSKFVASGEPRLGAQDYRYKVYAVNRFGKSMATAASAAVTVPVAGGAALTITPGVGPFQPSGFVILAETIQGSGKYYFAGTIAANGSTPVVFNDFNDRVPGTTTLFVLDLTSVGEMRTFMLKQLAPLHSVEFAKIGMYRHGVCNLYCTSVPYAPLRFVRIINVPVGVQSVNPRLLV